MIRFKAHFDGEKLCPDEPVTLPQGVTLEVTAAEASGATEPVKPQNPDVESVSPATLFQQIEQKLGLVEGPEDWAAEHDHYLYGAPKRSDDQCK